MMSYCIHGKVEEKKAVRTSCCTSWVGGRVYDI